MGFTWCLRKNHWNHWSKNDEKNDIGFHKINSLFQDKNIFKTSLAEQTFQYKQNFQSRAGEKKQYFDEYLFFGEKTSFNTSKKNFNDSNNILAEHNKAFKLNFFDYYTNHKSK